MLREFFCEGTHYRLAVAWCGLMIFVLHACYNAFLSWQLNGWFERFYDTLQTAVLDEARAAMRGEGSGALSDSDAAEVGMGTEAATAYLTQKRGEVAILLREFCVIVAPAIFIGPAASWFGSIWRMTWRMALMQTYLSRMDGVVDPVEGASQRIHEDTARFEQGMHRCLTMSLDSVLTLCVFAPVLLEIGERVQLPGWRWPPWLFFIASIAAFCGLGISMVVGRRLVRLEVENQRVEARLRKGLVLIENDADAVRTQWFHTTFAVMVLNYERLFANFAAFNLWIGLYNQSLTILPYALCAPLMFADHAADRVTLGLLVKLTNAFGKVFGALAILTENWGSVNEFRSTVWRLSEFERIVYRQQRRVRRSTTRDGTLLCSGRASAAVSREREVSIATHSVPTDDL